MRRLFDDGGLLVLDVEPAAGVADPEKLALATSFCTNPACECSDIELDAWRVADSPERKGPPDDALAARLDLESAELTVLPEATAAAAPGLADLLVRALKPDLLDLLRERWHRVKGQGDDEWRTVDWDRIELDALVPYPEVFPSQWDLSVVLDRRRYWAVDSWCLAPGCECGCDEIGVQFLDARGGEVGSLRVDVRRARVVHAPDGDPRLRPLGRELVSDSWSRDELRARRRQIRALVRELPGFLAGEPSPPAGVPAPNPGRNAACPCGSGKKYKRCCGR